MPGLNAAMHHLRSSPDPAVVFTQLAELLVPVVCDEAAAVVLVGPQLNRWQQQYPRAVTVDLPTARADGRVWTVTVHIAGHPAGNDDDDDDDDDALTEPDYVAVLTCSGRGEPLTVADVAVIKLAGRCAAAAVHQARQAALLNHQQRLVDSLQIALHTNRRISAAVGMVIARYRLPYPQAFQVLLRTSQASNRKLAAVADTVLATGTPPPYRVSDRHDPTLGSGGLRTGSPVQGKLSRTTELMVAPAAEGDLPPGPFECG